MTEALIILLVIFGLVNCVLLLMLFTRRGRGDDGARFLVLEKSQERLEGLTRSEMGKNREELQRIAQQNREETNRGMKGLSDSLLQRLAESSLQSQQHLERMRNTVEERLKLLQQDNSQRLEQMRATVDEKLQSTLEKRLGESFKQVSDRLEQVHRGLGEMQTLAAGVGDLRRVLTNVKTRGTWGEIQLGTLLENLMTPDQFGINVATKPGSRDRVEFAIRMPGKNGKETPVWLPIDAKFPQEDFHRLQEAQDSADVSKVEDAGKCLERAVKTAAKDIRDKYLEPPHTTDFAIMFLPIEALYAEVLRRPGLMEGLQREFRVTIAGPTTLSAFLNSLQMGFRTIAIEKRSSEVWSLLASVKNDFSQFTKLLDKTQDKLRQAGNDLEKAASTTKKIETRLRVVEQMPEPETLSLFGAQDN